MFKTLNFFLLMAFSVLVMAQETPLEESRLSSTTESTTGYESPLNAALDLQYTPISYEKYNWLDGQTSTRHGWGVHMGLEWLAYADTYGKAGLGLGTGFQSIEGTQLGSGISSTLYTMPIEASLSYRLDLMKNQFLVPFGRIGLNTVYSLQKTNVPDGTRAAYNWGFGWDLAAGAEICLNVIDRKTAKEFDAFIGVNNTYVVIEYISSKTLTGAKQPDFTNEQYRVGMRFEM